MQPYKLVKDHRTGVESSNVDAVMDGDIDLFINAYLKWNNLLKKSAAGAIKQLQWGIICATIVLVKTSVFPMRTKVDFMDKSGKYYIVKERALPEVLLKVVEAKRLIDSEKAMTVQEATDATGISRSSFINTKMILFLFMRMSMDGPSH